MRRRVGVPPFPLVIALLLFAGAPGPSRAQSAQGGSPTAGGPAGAQAETPGAPQASPPATAEPQEETYALSLEDCLRQALENNLDIVVRRYDPLRSETQVTLQESVFDPAIYGTATSSKNTDPRPTSFFRSDRGESYSASFEDPLISGGRYRFDLVGANDKPITFISPNGDPQYNTNWLLTVTQPLLRNFGPKANRWLILVARSNLGVSAAQFRQTVLDTLSNAEKAYWDLNFTLMDLSTKQGALRLAQDFLDQNRIKVRVGTLAPIEITQAEAGVASREIDVIVAGNAVSTAEDTIRRIMNVPRDSNLWSRPIRPSDPPPVQEVSPDMAAAVTTAEANRPDLEQARQTLAGREAELVYRKNQRRWGLDFKGTYGPQGFSEIDPLAGDSGSYREAFSDLAQGGKANWTAGLSLSIPLGNRQALANFTNAEYELTQARFDLDRVAQAARVEVRNAVRTVVTNYKRVKAAQVNTRLQKEKLDAEQKKFENGMSTSFQVLQFQTDLTTAQTGENQALVDYNKSLVELERVKGTLLESRKMTVPAGTAPGSGQGAAPGAVRGERAALVSPAEASSAALRPLWHRDADGSAAAAALQDTAAGDRVVLPKTFVLTGRKLVATGDRPAAASAPGGR